MTHRIAAEIKELEIPRRYVEDSTASKTTNERAKATLDQVRSGCFPPGVLSMRQNDSYVRQRIQEREVFSRVWGIALCGSSGGRGIGLMFKGASGTLDQADHHQVVM